MKKVLLFAMLTIFEIALAIAYGFLLQDVIPIYICLPVAFLFPFTVVHIAFKNKKDIPMKVLEAVVISLLLVSVAATAFSFTNQIEGEFIDEYDVIVELVSGRGGVYADFTTPDGREGRVNLNDYRIIREDDDYVRVGDIIRVQEYKGVFNRSYYVFVGYTDYSG